MSRAHPSYMVDSMAVLWIELIKIYAPYGVTWLLWIERILNNRTYAHSHDPFIGFVLLMETVHPHVRLFRYLLHLILLENYNMKYGTYPAWFSHSLTITPTFHIDNDFCKCAYTSVMPHRHVKLIEFLYCCLCLSNKYFIRTTNFPVFLFLWLV